MLILSGRGQLYNVKLCWNYGSCDIMIFRYLYIQWLTYHCTTYSIYYIYHLRSLNSIDFLFCMNKHKKHELYSFCTLDMYTHVQYKGYDILLSEKMIILLYIWCKKRNCSYFFFETWIVHQKTCLSIESIKRLLPRQTII